MTTSPSVDERRPLIGVSCYREQASWGVWQVSADLLPTTYVRAIELVGGIPVLLPPYDAPAPSAAAAVEKLDGLVIAGGADVNPARYGQEPQPRTARWRDERDASELALLAAADARQLPVLGVCRGMQLMAVYAGGVLEQHLPDVVGHHRHDPGGDSFGEVEVRMEAGTRLASLVGEKLVVHCHHHQAVRDHPGFVAAARAEDGTVEAMERPGDRFEVGVQWHPEMTHDAGLFRGLVHAATGHAQRR